MANAAIEIQNQSNVWSYIKAPFAFIGNFLVSLAETNVYIARIETLNAMTDEQLAERGLKREDIVRHVFADKMMY